MQGVVKKWGNSAAVPEAAHVRPDQPFDVREEGGRIVIEPLAPTRHDPIDTGTPAGRESW